ncbi:MAG TPA: FG-GAP-like repeat-containing protein [Thermoanaerobaculia bacterium]|nr:FG-GAP-like repeat-containing protein [Thermoanaerobaculia bacterium]
MRLLLPLLLAIALSLSAQTPRPISEPAVALRNLGLAQLENEQPGQAGETFGKLAAIEPGDPLPFANLAVALLRQQKPGEAKAAIGQALAKAPGRADLLAIQGDVFQGAGEEAEALAAYRKATAADPDRVTAWYSLYRQASSSAEPDAEAVQTEALRALERLRPDNLVVVIQAGQRAIQGGDRAAATKAFLRVRELLGQQAPPQAAPVLQQVMEALEAGEVPKARVPALRLDNVLKPTPAYQQGLRELTFGIQGIPVERFANEPPPATFGDPAPVTFRATAVAADATASVAAGDFDGDDRPDLARLIAGETPRLEIRKSVGEPLRGPEAPGISRLLAADLDNDGKLDLIGSERERIAFWRGRGEGTFEDATAAAGLSPARGEAATVADFDLEGDLDLALPGELFRNALEGPFAAVGAQVLPEKIPAEIRNLVASDLDRDGDPDLVIAHAQGIAWLDNLRQGRFTDRTAASGLASAGAALAVTSADLDNDGLPDLIAAGAGLSAWHNLGDGRFAPWTLEGFPQSKDLSGVMALDVDNDGRLDLAVLGPKDLVVLAQRGTREKPSFTPLPVEGAPAGISTLAAADLDGDGDLDLAAGGSSGLLRLENAGGNKNRWLAVRLRGLTQGNGKNNLFGLGATIEVRDGAAYQFREAAGPVTYLGLGQRADADVLRVVWTNGVPQNRLDVKGDQRIVEEQVLKGSCPFLYAWNGETFAFVTDLLWNSPVGLPVAPGVWAGSDPGELVRVDGVKAEDGLYRLRLTEELWEAAFFDAARLWVVDSPAGVETVSNLRVIPGERQPDRILGSRAVRPVVAAWDGRGHDATARVRARDDVYASGYEPSAYQGVAKEWTFTFDLGEAPAAPVRLHLDGWIFPADASLNLAVAQRSDLPYLAPRLEVEKNGAWEPLLPAMGFPAGKRKTMVVDVPPLPPGARRLRIVTSLWLAWDRVAWTVAPADDEPVVQAMLAPREADLRFRGFSALVRKAPNAPHDYDYSRTSKESPWIAFPGRYTRYGDVLPLLEEADDRSVILAPGDEIAVTFDASGLPPVRPGWVRTVFLESHGWDKDADRNTYEGQTLEPLPFRGMKAYGEPFPDTPEMRRYREEWLTREVR